MKNQFKIIKVVMILALLGVTSFAVFAQGSVNIPLGNIPAGQQITITYDATVNQALPSGLQYIVNQGVLSGDNIDDVLSDDPDIFSQTNDDPTLTAVTFNLPVSFLVRVSFRGIVW